MNADSLYNEKDRQVQLNSAEDWIVTIESLMQLAREATESFHYDKAIWFLNTAEEIWDSKSVPQISVDLRRKLHQEKGRVFALMGNLDRAVEEYEKVLKLCRDRCHLEIKSDTFTQIGQLLGKQGDYDRALGFHQRAIGAYRRLNDDEGLTKALRNLGVIYVELGEFEEAVEAINEAIDLASKANKEMLYADLMNNLGTIMNMRGEWKKALDYYRESLGIYRSNDEVRKSSYTMNNLAITFSEQGHYDEALSYFEEALETAEEIKDESLKLIVDINLADLLTKKGQIQQAKDHCDMALKHLEMSDRRNNNYVEVCKIRAQIAAHEKCYDEAVIWFNKALDLAKQTGAQYLEAEVLFERGNLNSLLEYHFEALTDLEASYAIFNSLKADAKINNAVESIEAIEKLFLKIFEAMALKVDQKDKYTRGHSDRVASISLLIAKDLGLDVYQQKTIVAGALLHDIGKIKIDDSILKKEGSLLDEEYRIIQRHPEHGINVLKGKEFPWDIKPLILHHHEKVDGTGYPARLHGEDIPFGARVICVADVFDALTSDRVYRKAFSTEKALEIMFAESGKTFDPIILNRFGELIRSNSDYCTVSPDESNDEFENIWRSCVDTGSIKVAESCSHIAVTPVNK